MEEGLDGKKGVLENGMPYELKEMKGQEAEDFMYKINNPPPFSYEYSNIKEYLCDNDVTIAVKFGEKIQLRRDFSSKYKNDFPNGCFLQSPYSDTYEENKFMEELFLMLAKERSDKIKKLKSA